MRLILIMLAGLALLPATAAAQDPVVVTGAAQAVGPTTATLTGSVDPNGAETGYHFEYGTTTAYGLETAEQPAGDGDEPVSVQAALQNLTPATTYHFRLVAGRFAGPDRSFTTVAVPGISGLGVADKTATSARLNARIDPNRAATTWYVEWGTSTAFGRRTPEQTLPAGDRAVAVSTALQGLPSYRRVYWRVVAANAAGVKRSGRTSFTTLRSPTGVTLSLSPDLTSWSRTISISGRIRGAGVNGLGVTLEQSSFPFDAGYHAVDAARSDRTGAFRFALRPVFLATRFRALLLVDPVLTSPVATVRVRPRVSIHRTHRTRRALRLGGGVNPGLPAGLATLQRRTRAGGWTSVEQRPLVAQDAVRSTYGFKVRRARRTKRYRVVVSAGDGGAHARGYSRALLIGKRR